MTTRTLLQPREAPARQALSGRLRPALLAAHVVAAVSVVGIDTALLGLAVAGASGTAPQTVYPAMHLIAADLLVPFAVAAFVTGLTQVAIGRWNVLREWWIGLKLVVTAAGTALAGLVLAPGLSKAGKSATAAGYPHFLSSGREHAYVIVLGVQLALLVMSAFLGVFKPGAGRRRGKTTA